MNSLIVAVVMWWRSLWDDNDPSGGTPLSNTDAWTFGAATQAGLNMGMA